MRNISFGIASLLAVFTALTVSLPVCKTQAGATSSTSAVLSIQKELDPIANPQDGRTKTKGWITGCVTDAVTDAPLAKVQIEVYARITDKLSDGTLSLRSTEETIPLGIVSYTNSKGKFKVKVPLGEDTKYFKVIAHAEGYQELQNVMVMVEHKKRSVVNFQLIKVEPTPQEVEILDQKHDLQKMNLLKKNPSFIQTMETTKKSEDGYTPPYLTDMKESFLYQQTYTVPDQVYVVNLDGFTGYVNFDDFISGVVSKELGSTFPFETLKAQAVASRSYALELYNRTGVANGGQAYTSTIDNTCRTATVNTSKIVILYGGNVISAYFSARCNGDSTLNSEDGVWHKTGTCSVGGNYVAYARSKPCSGHDKCNVKAETPCCNVTTGGRNVYIYGHGVGMCQRGAEQFACRDGKDWQQILTGYYTGITIANLPALDVGNRIVTTSIVNARPTPCSSGEIQIPSGIYGTIKAGPNISFCSNLGTCNGSSGTYWTWWQVDYDNGVAGRWSVENLLKRTSFDTKLPNLTPYQPSDWSDKIVVSKTTGTNIDSSPLYTTDTLYIDWAVINNGTGAITNTFYFKLYVDGVERDNFNIAGLNANVVAVASDYPIGTLSAGTHSIKIIADVTGVVQESNESDNEYTKTITVNIIDEAISTPSTPSGTTSGAVGTSYTYSTEGATSNLGHAVEYRFNWGDGTYSSWSSSATASKSWSSSGTYVVKAQARCATHTDKMSGESSGLSVTIGQPETVSTPSTPSGTTSGAVGTSYTYSTGGATSNLGHAVEYRFNWGDGTYSSWSSSTTASKSWSSSGTYVVKAQARCATHTDVVSSESSGLSVTIDGSHTVTAIINSISPNPAAQGTTVNFSGTGSDSSGHSIAAYSWRSSIDGGIGTSASFGKNNLSPGSHNIYLKVQCSNSAWSPEISWSGNPLVIGIIPPCTDLYETNDSFDLAYGPLTSGGNYQGKICSATDEDFFKIMVASPGMISLTLSVPSDKDYDIYLYNPSQEEVDSSTNGAGATENINYSATTVGTYYIYIYGYSGDYDESQTYTLSGSWPTTNSIDDQQPTVTITSPTSESAYTTTNGSLNLGGTASDNVGVTQVTWSNNRGGSGTATGTTNWSISGITLQSGANVITVKAWDAASNTETDTITVTVTQCTDLYETNDSFDLAYGPLTSGSSYQGKICSATDEDYFKIMVASPGMISLTLSVPSDKDYEIYLYNPSQEAVDSSTNGEGATENINYSATTVGTYYIRIIGYEGAYDESQTYTLSGSWTNDHPPTVTITSPTSESAYTTTSSSLNLAGTASDNVGVTQVTWSNSRGGSGTANGTTNWSISGITLQSGANVITVTAWDAASNTETDTITVTYSDGGACAYTISPTSKSFGFSGNFSSVAVTASPGSCSWTASSNATWITITSGSRGTGNGTIYYSVSYNTGANVRTGTMTIAEQTFTVTQRGIGNLVTDTLWIRAVINTEEKGPVDAVWQKGGESITARGDTAIWGHFYASPSDVSWGSQNNPDLYVKIWFDVSGRIDVNYFHVSVPDIAVYSEYPYNGSVDLQGTTTMSRRYIRHYFQGGTAFPEENYEDGIAATGYNPKGNPAGYMTINNLKIGSLINTEEKGPVGGVWRLGGQDTTARGDQAVWGFYYASPSDVSWGNQDNPDLYVKIWFDVSGRIDVNYFHVSVPDIEAYSDYPSDGFYNQKGTTIIADRYIRHQFWK